MQASPTMQALHAMHMDVAIIGGGPAGMAAALAAKEAGANDVAIIERDGSLGGILQQCIHNGFGVHRFQEELTGPEYAQRDVDAIAKAGIIVLADTMVLHITSEKIITAVNPNLGLFQIEARGIVLAMGCRERPRGALGIPGSRPSGIYTAGTAQYLVNIEGELPGKDIVILGSGDIGLIMARRLTWEGAKVHMVCEILPWSSGLSRNIVQCLDDNSIPLLFKHTVVRIHGKGRVEGVTIAEVDGERKPIAGTEKTIACDTLLLAAGLIPENELSREAGVELDPATQGPVVDQDRQTSMPGIFACGNVLHVHDLVDHVSAEGGTAGRAASKHALGDATVHEAYITVHAGDGVRYTVPQRITKDADGDIELFFRTRSKIAPAELIISSRGKALMTKKKAVMTPGEMEHTIIPAKLFKNVQDSIEITVKEPYGNENG